MADLSVIIVTWNNEEEIGKCISSLIDCTKNIGGFSWELIVIDNASTDKTLREIGKFELSNLQIYKNSSNTGYTKAVNQALRYSTGEKIFLLNPDAFLNPEAIRILTRFLDNNSSYGACSPLLLNEDGSIQHSIRNFPSYWTMYCEFYLLAYIFPKSKIFGKWKMKYFDYSHSEDVNQPMAAAFMVRKSILNTIGMMDERFEMFFNDVDLCKRIIDSGSKIRFIIDASAIHKKGASVLKNRTQMIKTWNRDCYKYFKKHHRNTFFLFWLIINLKISELIRIAYIKIFK